MNIEEEKYIKCPDCDNVSGCFLNHNDDLIMFCGNCKERKQFIIISKEEYEVIQYQKQNQEE